MMVLLRVRYVIVSEPTYIACLLDRSIESVPYVKLAFTDLATNMHEAHLLIHRMPDLIFLKYD